MGGKVQYFHAGILVTQILEPDHFCVVVKLHLEIFSFFFLKGRNNGLHFDTPPCKYLI